MDYQNAPLSPRGIDSAMMNGRSSVETSSPRSIYPIDFAGPGSPTGQMPVSIINTRARGSFSMGSGLATALSPPKAKSTSHVPCKFYPIGQCQAGSACQFSHDLDPISQNAPCRYFSKGSCKFGHSCALLHILNGRIINRPQPRGQAAPQYNTRDTSGSNGLLYSPNGPASPLITNTQDNESPTREPASIYNNPAHDTMSPNFVRQANSPIFRAEIHMSNSSSPYGSPMSDLNLPRSLPRVGLSARDAQLPSSWDSQGVFHTSRTGPYAASVPGRFGLETPSSSFANKAQIGDITQNDPYEYTANINSVLEGLGSPPRESEALSFSKMPLHAERFGRSRPSLSSSLDIRPVHFPPDIDRSASENNRHDDIDSEDDDDVGEDLLPSSLHDLLPTDRPRRYSRTNAQVDDDSTSSHWNVSRRGFANHHTSNDSVPGSISPASASPSRYSAMWAARSAGTRAEPDVTPVSAFGHVGSPLRPSNLRTSSTHNNNIDSFSSSPLTPAPITPVNPNGSNLSMLTSQLRNARLTSAPPPQMLSPPRSTPTIGLSDGKASEITSHSHTLLGSSAGSSNTTREKPEDEAMFSMEEEHDTTSLSGSKKSEKKAV